MSQSLILLDILFGCGRRSRQIIIALVDYATNREYYVNSPKITKMETLVYTP